MGAPSTAAAVNARQAYDAKRQVVHMHLEADIGASGAITVDSTETDSGVSVSKNTTGVYDITYPACLNASIVAQLLPTGTPDLAQFVLAAKSATAGTAQVQHVAAGGSVANPANGDKLIVDLWLNAK